MTRNRQDQTTPIGQGRFFDLASDPMGVAGNDKVYKAVNEAWQVKLGYALEDLAAIPYTDLVHVDERPSAEPRMDEPGPQIVELRLRTRNDSYRWLEWTTFPYPDRDEIFTIGRDISLRKSLEEQAREAEQKLQDLVENAEDAICTADLEGHLTSINRAAERMSGSTRAEAIGTPFANFVAPEYRPLLKKMTELKLAGKPSTVFEVEVVRKDGMRIPVELNTKLVFRNGKPVGVSGIARDIRVRKQLADDLQQRNDELERANAMIRSLMNQDPLTKLANRRSLEDALEKALSLTRRSEQPLSVVLADIDRFKRINDNFGHASGDEVLSAFGGLLGISCRKEDTAARYGGEEFLLLLPNTAMDAAIEFAERVRARTESLRVPSGANITASFGVAEFAAGDTIDSLISRADAALYGAKERGRNRVESR